MYATDGRDGLGDIHSSVCYVSYAKLVLTDLASIHI
jgi:hypothetical protein